MRAPLPLWPRNAVSAKVVVPALVVLASFGATSPAKAIDGDGDPTFRGTSWFVADVPSLGGRAAAVTADGRLLIGYTAVLTGTDKDMRVMPVPDSGVTIHCASYHPDLGGTDDDRLADIAVYNGRVYLAGRAAGPQGDTPSRFAMAAFDLGNCALWSSFGGSNGLVIDSTESLEGTATAIDRFGGVDVALQHGASNNWDLISADLSATGVPEGSTMVDFAAAFGATSFEPKAIALQPDGKRVVAGTVVMPGGDRDVGVARFTVQGGLDGSFSIDGILAFSYDIIDAGADEGLAVGVLPGGAIVVGGNVERASGTQAAVAILTPTGGFQNSFGLVGRYVFDFLAPDRLDTVRALALQGDGKIVVAGSTGPLPPLTDSDFALARLLISGSQPLDPSFGGGGTVRVIFDEGGDHADAAYDLTLGQGGKITVVGAVATDSGTAIAAARLKNAYIFADSFEWGNLLGGEWGGVWGGDE